MPKKAIDYSKIIMYKIVCNDLAITDIYVGHTTDFTKRKCNHKTSCYNPNDKKNNLKLYQIIRENGGWTNWSMVQIEEYSCSNSNEAGARERYWYETLNANMNNKVPNRSEKEFKNIIFNCECGGKYTNTNKSRHFKSIKHQTFIQKTIGNLQEEQLVEVEELDLVC
jgi:hypothetical protein